jgi:hypothetical protein
MRRRVGEIGRGLLARSLVVVTIGWAGSAAMAQETPPPSGLPQQPDIQQMQQMPIQEMPGTQQQQGMRKLQDIPGLRSERIVSETASVVNVDKQKRKLTLQDAQGQKVTLDAGSAIPNFDAIREGDKVNAKFYQAAAIAIHKPGEAATTTEIQTGTARLKASRPMGMVGETVTTTASVTSVDASKKELTLRWPDGKSQTLTVDDPKLQQTLSTLKAGDQVSVSYTEAAAITVMPQK